MLSPVIYLMLHSLFFPLRLSGGGGSFPRPLKAAEEREYLTRCAQGDLEARNVLVEHNLRLVAHIVKKYYAQTGCPVLPAYRHPPRLRPSGRESSRRLPTPASR